MYKATFGNATLQLPDMGISTQDMIFDSGSSLSYIPKKAYEIFVKELKKNHVCRLRKDDGMYECQCKGIDDDTFPKLSVNVGSDNVRHWFYMEGMDYMLFQRYSRTCIVLVKSELA